MSSLICCQVGGGMGFLYMGTRLLPINRRATFKAIFKRRAAVCYYFSIMLVHNVGFSPKCQTCESPQECLVYTECLKHGSVMLDGRDACRPNFWWSERALQTLLSTTNMSAADLACERTDAWCEDMESLKEANCSSVGERCVMERTEWAI
jgi:hypothetical protein